MVGTGSLQRDDAALLVLRLILASPVFEALAVYRVHTPYVHPSRRVLNTTPLLGRYDLSYLDYKLPMDGSTLISTSTS